MRADKLENNHCLQCNKLIWNNSILCKRCAKLGINNPFCGKYVSIKTKKLQHKLHYIHGGKSRCIDCGKSIDYRSKRCKPCAVKKQHKDNVFNYHRKPTTPELILIKLLPKIFKYVGNNKLSIGTFNPDFIDIKNKRIIEMFGDYWHNIKNQKKKDKIKLSTYKKLGYNVLVIWEKETKNKDILIKKLNNFIGEKI